LLATIAVDDVKPVIVGLCVWDATIFMLLNLFNGLLEAWLRGLLDDVLLGLLGLLLGLSILLMSCLCLLCSVIAVVERDTICPTARV